MIWDVFNKLNGYPQAQVRNEGGFVDVSLCIEKYEKLHEGVVRILIQNSLYREKFGFVVELQPEWTPQRLENMGADIYWGDAQFISTGADSNAFLGILSKLYGIQDQSLCFSRKLDVRVAGLLNDPSRIEHEPIKMKFFLNSEGSDELYSEVFINVDIKKKVLEFNEKDIGYRSALIKSLGMNSH